MSEEEEDAGLEEEEVAKPKKPELAKGSVISQINQSLDDFSFNLAMSFPSFGIGSNSKSQYVGNSGGSDTRGAGLYSSYAPPRDLMTRKEPSGKLENELYVPDNNKADNNLRESSRKGSYHNDHNYGKGSNHSDHNYGKGSVHNDQNFGLTQGQTREFGIQTSDSFHMEGSNKYLRKPNENRKVEFEEKGNNSKNKVNYGKRPTESSAPMRMFSKNVQDLYKRKPKQVYGEDEFRISGQTHESRFQ